LRGVANLSREEGVIYNYWVIVVYLLRAGIPYDVINRMPEADLAMILATFTAVDQREAQQEARLKRMTQG